MNRPPARPGALTSLDSALAALLDGLEPVAPRLVPLDQAIGRVAAGMPPLAQPLPARNIAVMDGWALCALDLVGASAYSPLALPAAPAWVETGDAMPEGCDCVLRAALVDCTGPIAQAMGEAAPGEGVRRAGQDLAAGRAVVLPGRPVCAADLLVARRTGHSELAVRSPRIRVIDVAAANGDDFAAALIVQSGKAAGAMVAELATVARDAASIGEVLESEACDLTILIGGTGEGRTDATTEALAGRGALIAHGIALRPGSTSAIGRLRGKRVIALPGSPDQAFAGFLALVQPVLDGLSARSVRRNTILPLAQKISSTVGMAEIALVKQEQNGWIPLAVGDFSLDAMRLADAWLAIPGGSEGYAAGTPVGAFRFATG